MPWLRELTVATSFLQFTVSASRKLAPLFFNVYVWTALSRRKRCASWERQKAHIVVFGNVKDVRYVLPYPPQYATGREILCDTAREAGRPSECLIYLPFPACPLGLVVRFMFGAVAVFLAQSGAGKCLQRQCQTYN